MPTHTHTHHKPFLLISNRKLATPSLSLSHIYTHTHIYIYIHIYNTYIHTCIHTHAHTHRVNPFPLFRTGNWLPHLPPPRRAQQTLQLRAITLARKVGKIDKFPFHGHLQSTTLPFFIFFQETGYPIFLLYDEHNKLFNFGFFFVATMNAYTSDELRSNGCDPAERHCWPAWPSRSGLAVALGSEELEYPGASPYICGTHRHTHIDR